eukprot:350561-Chlamydomonas_euryale.AAC.2
MFDAASAGLQARAAVSGSSGGTNKGAGTANGAQLRTGRTATGSGLDDATRRRRCRRWRGHSRSDTKEAGLKTQANAEVRGGRENRSKR